jgi:ABC-type transport system involved in multi-copper enzyme maturation permease subunit
MRRGGLLLAAVAWLPALLPPLRRGEFGIAAFDEMISLQVAVGGVVLPLLALLAGVELLAGEREDGSLVPLLTLPLSRGSCLLGKGLGRAAALGAVYLACTASAGAAVAMARGTQGARDWAAVAGAGLLLGFATGGVGLLLGAAGRGRVRAFAAALVAWVVLVLALDAALLTAVVALAPSPPAEVGSHGHAELRAPGAAGGGDDPHARHAEPAPASPTPLAGWLLAINPVSLYRLTALALSPGLRPRLGLALPGFSGVALGLTLAAGWLVWLLVPPAAAHWIFRRVDLS